MRFILYMLLAQLVLTTYSTQVYAGVAVASTGEEVSHGFNYDLSDMTPQEAEWFRTFLNGTFFTDGWQQISDTILLNFDAEERMRQRLVLERLGYKIGREWCRSNDERKISTPMLRKWGRILKSTVKEEPRQLAEVLEEIDVEVDSLLR